MTGAATERRKVCAITGASGYVGSRLAASLAAAMEVVPLGRKPGERGLRWDLGDPTPIRNQLRERGVSVLVHAAWDFSQPKPQQNWNRNVLGSLRLLGEAQSAGVKRIVFVSTISAFPGAVSEYGKAKLAVERAVLEAGGTAIRPGLVWGETPGGMFGAIRKQVSKGGIVPTIGDGRFPQYLVHEADLAEAVRLLAEDDSTAAAFQGKTLTLAHSRPWRLRDLILRLAAEQGTQVRLAGVPWRMLYAALKGAEMLGLHLNFRSDSVLSLVRQNLQPIFDAETPVKLREFR